MRLSYAFDDEEKRDHLVAHESGCRRWWRA